MVGMTGRAGRNVSPGLAELCSGVPWAIGPDSDPEGSVVPVAAFTERELVLGK